jgi:hypothetical protein
MIPLWEKIVETKKCRLSGAEFFVTDKDLEFYDKISPIFGGEKYAIPSPTLCPEERSRRRLSYRNELTLYTRECDLSGKEIISIYNEECDFPVYEPSAWWSDKWSPKSINVDFSRVFFSQFWDLQKIIPRPALLHSNNENSLFNNYIDSAKNCYMSSVVYYESENIYFSRWIFNSKDIFDSLEIQGSQKCFSCIQLTNCMNCEWSIRCTDSSEILYSHSLLSCHDCLLCVGLKNKKYCILNKQYSQEEYLEKKTEFQKLSWPQKQKIFSQNKNTFSYRNLYQINCENSYSDFLKNSKNTFSCFSGFEIEDCKFLTGEKIKNAHDGVGGSIEWAYEFHRSGLGGQNFCFVNDVIFSRDIYYSENIANSSNLLIELLIPSLVS